MDIRGDMSTSITSFFQANQIQVNFSYSPRIGHYVEKKDMENFEFRS